MKKIKLLDGNYIYVYNNGLYKKDCISRIIINSKDYFESKELNFIKNNFYKDMKNIIDIGANIGNHTLFFLNNFKDSIIYSFEPHPDNFKLLKQNTINYDRSKIYNLGISNKKSNLPMYTNSLGQSGSFSFYNYQNENVPKSNLTLNNINVDKLDNFNNLQDITFMKIDVENHEFEVLQGAFNIINKNKPIIWIENLSFSKGYDYLPDNINTILNEYNYIILLKLNNINQIWIPKELEYKYENMKNIQVCSSRR